jgi:hypothetical protein
MIPEYYQVVETIHSVEVVSQKNFNPDDIFSQGVERLSYRPVVLKALDA